MMEKYKEDFTNTFVSLTLEKIWIKECLLADEFKNWYKNWQERLERQAKSIG